MQQKVIKLGVSGALGKMGSRILTLASQDRDFKIALALERAGHPQANSSVAGLVVASSAEGIKDIDVLIDFSSPQATSEHVALCLACKKPLVVGTTGLSEAQKSEVSKAAQEIPIVFAPNMSVGVNLLYALVRRAAETLPSDYSVRMTEAHHIHKKDAPSGTAKWLQQLVCQLRKQEHVDIQSVREGEIIGDHEVVFDSPWDTIRISHSAKTRDIFAKGALAAAKFVVTKKKGLFTMTDVIGASR
ncbi:MAG: 4-hydroxy-tetrahydrodipicolinate reductase [Candidatus Omnitrophota bacterium]